MVLAFISNMPLSILFLFFRNFIGITTAITLFQCYLLAGSGKPLFAFPMLFTKLASDALIAMMYVFFGRNKLYFYYNLGISKQVLFVSALVFDAGIWFLLVALTLIFL
jgi:hypothetical protein